MLAGIAGGVRPSYSPQLFVIFNIEGMVTGCTVPVPSLNVSPLLEVDELPAEYPPTPPTSLVVGGPLVLSGDVLATFSGEPKRGPEDAVVLCAGEKPLAPKSPPLLLDEGPPNWVLTSRNVVVGFDDGVLAGKEKKLLLLLDDGLENGVLVSEDVVASFAVGVLAGKVKMLPLSLDDGLENRLLVSEDAVVSLAGGALPGKGNGPPVFSDGSLPNIKGAQVVPEDEAYFVGGFVDIFPGLKDPSTLPTVVVPDPGLLPNGEAVVAAGSSSAPRDSPSKRLLALIPSLLILAVATASPFLRGLWKPLSVLNDLGECWRRRSS